MSLNSFGKSSGPGGVQRGQAPILNFPPPPSRTLPIIDSAPRNNLSSPLWRNKWTYQRNQPSAVSPFSDTHDSERNLPMRHDGAEVPKGQTTSPPLPSTSEPFWPSPSELHTRSYGNMTFPNSQSYQQPPQSKHIIDSEAKSARPASIPVAKRGRSPPLPSSDQIIQENSFSAQDSSEREMQAKAKRLARFKDELSQPVETSLGFGNRKVPARRHDHSNGERQKFIGEPTDAMGDFSSGNVPFEYEGLETSSIIVGLCPDMCPESERAERERKGDLDRFERLDGDRNQTSKSLAVKKYTRTAEREADLIRPMPILQRTMDYLLNLLDQPYSDKFLNLYNFLWDRMRAIRMDLRMQHIFNLEAITMLEQMIRLHIIAMHELCEYSKGEGFSEGFDAHLNIEQMNKTSVELFQLYDDHRKKEVNVPSEKEFRGYYALLKLDKHPGYKVEPAELSLDLAKMTPEIRQTPEVLFARDVARACRTGNFIAFFRLARKASYLQACLMHAHFAKLRTLALASLHGGLQNNQGIPIAHVAKWIGMEDEDIEDLIEYHGFSIKEFEEPYMVKEGPFLSGENDYPLKCSKLVHMKKSRQIVEDVSSPCLVRSPSSPKLKSHKLATFNERENTSVHVGEPEVNAQPIDDDEMADYETDVSPQVDMPVTPLFNTLVADRRKGDHQQMVTSTVPLAWDFSSARSSSPKNQQNRVRSAEKLTHHTPLRNSLEKNRFPEIKATALPMSPRNQQNRVRSSEKLTHHTPFRNSLEKNRFPEIKATALPESPRAVEQERSPSSEIDSAAGNMVPKPLPFQDMEDDEDTDIHTEVDTNEDETSLYDEEVAEAKLKLIIRLWRRRSEKKRELREQKQLEANAALSSLSLGPRIQHYKQPPSTFYEFDIDRLMSARYQNQKQSWSRLNVSEVIADKLSTRNPNAECLCWKIVICSQTENELKQKQSLCQFAHLSAARWLLSKVIPPTETDEQDLIISNPGLSIWKKWVRQSDGNTSCCLSIIKDTKFCNLDDAVAGAGAVLFVLSEYIPFELQKNKLHNLLMSLPSGSNLPLLILTGSNKGNNSDTSTIAEKLDLFEFDKSQVSKFMVISLVENQQKEDSEVFFSDEKLREGLQWLASESPPQPKIRYVKTRDLILSHLNPSLEMLEKSSSYQVGPDDCISAFNKVLDQSIKEVSSAAAANPCSWPCPEVDLLEESNRGLCWNLPMVGWSSVSKIEPLVFAMNQCMLPSFSDDISWLKNGSETGDGIETHRLNLESCLINYLSQSIRLMDFSLATKEVNVMTQRCSKLELHDSNYYIVPDWVMIFRRVFNWRLMVFSSEPFSSAYILEEEEEEEEEEQRLQLHNGNVYLVSPSLDEMVDVCYNNSVESGSSLGDEICVHPPLANGCDEVEATQDDDTDEILIENNGLMSRELVPAAAKEGDRLSELLEKCNLVQKMIDEKLSFYF